MQNYLKQKISFSFQIIQNQGIRKREKEKGVFLEQAQPVKKDKVDTE